MVTGNLAFDTQVMVSRMQSVLSKYTDNGEYGHQLDSTHYYKKCRKAVLVDHIAAYKHGQAGKQQSVPLAVSRATGYRDDDSRA